MAINLEEWVNKKVKVTLKDGDEHTGIIMMIVGINPKKFYIRKSSYDLVNFYADGRNVDFSQYNIIKIEPITMNTKELQKQIEQTQLELNKLQEELKKAEEQEKFNSEFYTPIKDEKQFKVSLKFLKDYNYLLLPDAFSWIKTPQGYLYWNSKSYGNYPDERLAITQEDILHIKDWVINYLIQKQL